MEKRLIVAIVLSVAIIFAYQYFFVTPPPRKPAAPAAGTAAGTENAARPPSSPAPREAAAEGPALAPKRGVKPRLIVVRTPKFTATVDTEGGGIRSFLLNDYKDVVGPKGKPLEIVRTGDARPLPLDFVPGESQPALPLRPVFDSDAPDRVSLAAGEKKSLVMAWESDTGVRIAREYQFSGDKYEFEVRVRVKNGPSGNLTAGPGLSMSQEFAGALEGDTYSFYGVVVESGKSVKRYSLKDIGKGKAAKEPVRWAAADSKYFALILLPEKEWVLGRVDLEGENRIRFAAGEAPSALGPGEDVRLSARVFMGPKEYNLLEATGKNLTDLVDYGFFSILAKPLVWLLTASNRATKNYGIDIIILTILIKVAFFPLTQKSMASMKKMQELAPIMTKLREKYKDDKARLNEEMMNLYRTYKINPFSGCLPILLQIPVFIALYKGLLVAIELRHAPFFFWINDLSAPEHLYDVVVAGYAIPLRLLPLLMGISMFIQQKMTPTGGMDPAQAKVMLVLPVIFTFMFWGFPTGLVIYWLVNNVLQIGQQHFYNRKTAMAKA